MPMRLTAALLACMLAPLAAHVRAQSYPAPTVSGITVRPSSGSAAVGGISSAGAITGTSAAISGALHIPGTGVPVAVQTALAAQAQTSANQTLVDTNMLRQFGLIGDGGQHPLSATYGTLAAAQAVYPWAISLNDSMDWIAIQGAINTFAGAGSTGARLVLPNGQLSINEPIVGGSAPVTIEGQGSSATRIFAVLTSSQDLFQYGPLVQVATLTNGFASISATNNFTAGQQIYFDNTVGSSSGQIIAGNTYYVLATGLSGTTFEVSATSGGTAITLNASGLANVSGVAVYGSGLAVNHVGIYTTTAGSIPRYIFNVQTLNTGHLNLDDVTTGSYLPYNSAACPTGIVNGNGIGSSYWHSVHLDCGSFNVTAGWANGTYATQTAVTLNAIVPGNSSSLFVDGDSFIGAQVTAIKINNTCAGCDIEGVYYLNSGGRTNTGPWFQQLHTGASGGGGLYSPMFVFENDNFEGASNQLLSFASASEIHINHGLFYSDGYRDLSGAPTQTAADYIYCGQCNGVYFDNTIVAAFPGSVISHLLNFAGYSSRVTIRDSAFQFQGLPVTYGGGIVSAIASGSGNTNIRSFNNSFFGAPAGTFWQYVSFATGTASATSATATLTSGSASIAATNAYSAGNSVVFASSVGNIAAGTAY